MYLNDELKLFCSLQFSLKLHRIPRVFHLQRNRRVFQVFHVRGHPVNCSAVSLTLPLVMSPTNGGTHEARHGRRQTDRRTDERTPDRYIDPSVSLTLPLVMRPTTVGLTKPGTVAIMLVIPIRVPACTDRPIGLLNAAYI